MRINHRRMSRLDNFRARRKSASQALITEPDQLPIQIKGIGDLGSSEAAKTRRAAPFPARGAKPMESYLAEIGLKNRLAAIKKK